MICNQIQHLIPEWLDGEVSVAESEKIQQHIDNCAACREEVSFWQSIGTTLREDMGTIKAPEGFTAGVMAQLPQQRHSAGMGRLFTRWKRSIAVAATFMLMAVGSAGAYLTWGGNIVSHVAKNNPNSGHVNNELNLPTDGINNNNSDPVHEQPVIAEEPNITNNDEGDGHTPSGDDAGKGTTPQQPTAASNPTPDNTDSQGVVQSEQYAFLNIDKNRVIERTLLQVKVEDMDAAHQQALNAINNFSAQYEVMGTENIPGASQETLKVTVGKSYSAEFMDNLQALGQVIDTDIQQDDISDKYNDKVEQYRSLQAQIQSTTDTADKKELQIEMASIESQLKDWDREADTDTIILLLKE